MKHIQFRPFSLSALPSALKRSAAVLAAVLAASLLTGCEPARHHHGPPAPQPVYFTELEPNDTPDFPDFVGYVDELSFLVVEGHVEAFGYDIVDHIEFIADQPMEVDFTLEAFGAYGDVDVSIYDPIANQIVGTYASDGRYEAGTLVIHEAGRPFQFIIEAYNTSSAWSLEIVGYPHGCACRTSAGLGANSSDLDGSKEASNLDLSRDAEASLAPAALPPFEAKQEHDILRAGSK
ncbi:hypothetical protein Poly30_25120 [Planctomycetes bacterium Poly30]|uniref:Lipoprotein n=1 Tax=Saltatorellus ferox TaxID=2528018 RepID=A0A518ESD4_9BACT|nr:hypothetical protein Poly30_25120 [Planctomycetes bacterium Poly30]